jgi:hypothetical protein
MCNSIFPSLDISQELAAESESSWRCLVDDLVAPCSARRGPWGPLGAQARGIERLGSFIMDHRMNQLVDNSRYQTSEDSARLISTWIEIKISTLNKMNQIVDINRDWDLFNATSKKKTTTFYAKVKVNQQEPRKKWRWLRACVWYHCQIWCS